MGRLEQQQQAETNHALPFLRTQISSTVAVQSPHRVALKLEHVDGEDPGTGLLRLPVVKYERHGIYYYRPLASFSPRYEGGWQVATIHAIFGPENLCRYASRYQYRQFQILKANEEREQSDTVGQDILVVT